MYSFLGTIGELVSGSEIEKALHIADAENIVPHMLTGKDYSSTLRRHILVFSAVTALKLAVILKFNPSIEKKKLTSKITPM